ncbi:hypothetical protein ABEB36_000116 [Hypothenemus hampei]|uniref:THAP-type domain-containing protein n=1 Tax=Hypothenemus hampei TaxID=57062 RepID=A0ABD1FAS5_HYPHA
MRCVVFSCNEDDQAKDFKRGEVRFYRFPTDPVVLKAWRNACTVCCKHFKKTDYIKDLKCELLGYNPKNRRLLKPDSVSTENIINNLTSSFSVVSASTSQRINRAEKRSRSSIVRDLLKQQVEKENGITVYGDGMNEHEGVCVNSFLEVSNIQKKDAGTITKFDDRDEIIGQLKQQVTELKNQM